MNTWERSRELNTLADRIIQANHINLTDPRQRQTLLREIMQQANCSITTARCVVERAVRQSRNTRK